MLKRLAVLAMAIGVMAAFALPASATANWKHHNTETQQDVQIGLTGQVKFATGFGEAECQFKAQAKFFAAQTTGVLETFIPHPTDSTTNCKGYGAYAPCQTHNLTPQVPNWTIHTGSSGGNAVILITTQALTATPTGAFCPGKHILFTGGTIVATPNQANTFSSLALSGTLLTHKQTNSGELDTENVTISGLLNVVAPNASTYSL